MKSVRESHFGALVAWMTCKYVLTGTPLNSTLILESLLLTRQATSKPPASSSETQFTITHASGYEEAKGSDQASIGDQASKKKNLAPLKQPIRNKSSIVVPTFDPEEPSTGQKSSGCDEVLAAGAEEGSIVGGENVQRYSGSDELEEKDTDDPGQATRTQLLTSLQAVCEKLESQMTHRQKEKLGPVTEAFIQALDDDSLDSLMTISATEDDDEANFERKLFSMLKQVTVRADASEELQVKSGKLLAALVIPPVLRSVLCIMRPDVIERLSDEIADDVEIKDLLLVHEDPRHIIELAMRFLDPAMLEPIARSMLKTMLRDYFCRMSSTVEQHEPKGHAQVELEELSNKIIQTIPQSELGKLIQEPPNTTMQSMMGRAVAMADSDPDMKKALASTVSWCIQSALEPFLKVESRNFENRKEKLKIDGVTKISTQNSLVHQNAPAADSRKR